MPQSSAGRRYRVLARIKPEQISGAVPTEISTMDFCYPCLNWQKLILLYSIRDAVGNGGCHDELTAMARRIARLIRMTCDSAQRNGLFNWAEDFEFDRILKLINNSKARCLSLDGQGGRTSQHLVFGCKLKNSRLNAYTYENLKLKMI